MLHLGFDIMNMHCSLWKSYDIDRIQVLAAGRSGEGRQRLEKYIFPSDGFVRCFTMADLYLTGGTSWSQVCYSESGSTAPFRRHVPGGLGEKTAGKKIKDVCLKAAR